MSLKIIPTGICVIILIACLISAGCTSSPEGSAATPAAGTSPGVTPEKTVPSVTAAVTARTTSLPAAGATTDPWANFVLPTTTLPGEATAEETAPGVTGEITAGTTPEPTDTGAPEVIMTEPPTPIPTMPSVADTCSNIGGNVCMANETCSGAFIKTTDEAQCCAGVCEAK